METVVVRMSATQNVQSSSQISIISKPTLIFYRPVALPAAQPQLQSMEDTETTAFKNKSVQRIISKYQHTAGICIIRLYFSASESLISSKKPFSIAMKA